MNPGGFCLCALRPHDGGLEAHPLPSSVFSSAPLTVPVSVVENSV